MGILGRIDTFITWFDGVVWGLPLIILILVTGIFLTVRLGLLQVRYLGKALKFMVKNEEDGHGEVTSFELFVPHYRQQSVPVISSVWQLQFLQVDRERYSG